MYIRIRFDPQYVTSSLRILGVVRRSGSTAWTDTGVARRARLDEHFVTVSDPVQGYTNKSLATQSKLEYKGELGTRGP